MDASFEHGGEEKKNIKNFDEMLKRGESEYLEISTYEFLIDHFVEMGEFKKALKACELGLHQHPYSGEMKVDYAQVLFQTGHLEESLTMLEEAENFQPGDIEISLLRANILLQQNKFAESIVEFEKTLPIREDEDLVYYSMGLANVGLGHMAKAISCFKRTLEVNINHEDALLELTTCLDLTDQLGASLPFYTKFIDADPYSASAWYNMGIVNDKLKKYEDALQAYDYAIIIEEDFSSAYFNMGNTYMSVANYDKALECFKKTEELEEWDDPNLFLCFGQCHHRLREFEKAIRFYHKSIAMDQLMEQAWFGIGESLDQMERWYESIHFYKKALELDELNPMFMQAIAEAEYKTGNVISAIAMYDELVELEYDNTQAWLDYSFIFYEQGNESKASEIILEAIEFNPKDAELHYRVAAYLIDAGNYKEAFNYLENALILDFEKHVVLFDFFPDLEKQKALMKIIDQFNR